VVARFRQPNRELTVPQVRRVEELLPAGHLARFVWGALMALDFGPLEALYPSIQGRPGAPPCHPRILMALWTYGMCQGLSTAAAIAKACTLRDDFRWLAGGLQPCDQTLLNFVARAVGSEALLWIWSQVLWALQSAGQIDLSAVLEDGTKVRANASPRSFLPAAEIAAVVEQLKSQLATKLDSQAKQADAVCAKDERALRIVREKLARAELAVSELERRRQARDPRPADAPPRREKLVAAGFKHDAQRDVLVCPAGEALTFRGTYLTTNRKDAYRLYQRSDCNGCPLKASCTDARGRRVKVQRQAPAPLSRKRPCPCRPRPHRPLARAPLSPTLRPS
jgi:transposase